MNEGAEDVNIAETSLDGFEDLHFTNEASLTKRIQTAIKQGKHIVLIGPPGTGKSKLAKTVANEYKDEAWEMTTATSDWSTFHTIGGYRPTTDDELEFNPGIFLKRFKDDDYHQDSEWLIIDEINRADIDKAFGSLFSALTEDNITLPFETREGEEIELYGDHEGAPKHSKSEYAIPEDWRLIATMNTMDKTSLYEMSYAFMRRFAFIPVGIPDLNEVGDETKLIQSYAECWDVSVQGREDRLFNIWKAINETQEIGPAIVEDIAAYTETNDEKGVYASAIALYVLPQLEGKSENELEGFVEKVQEHVDDAKLKKAMKNYFDHYDG